MKNNIIPLVLFGAILILLFIYFSLQHNRFNYTLYLYGRAPAHNHLAVVMLMADDGAVVRRPHLHINGTAYDGNIINIGPQVKVIETEVGKWNTHFDISWEDILNKARYIPENIQFSKREKAEAGKIGQTSRIGNRRIFLLPSSFRMVPEFDIPGFVYCLAGEEPCADDYIEVDGVRYPMKNGAARVTFRMPPNGMAVISFPDGTTAGVAYPFKGKMFWWDETQKALTLRTLIPLERIMIDCYHSGTWLFSDVVSSQGSLVLPKRYEQCDRIQASFDSGAPGTSFAVFTAQSGKDITVTDPYYQPLVPHIKQFGQQAAAFFLRVYPRSVFIPLLPLYNGRLQEEKFLKEQAAQLHRIWWLLLILITVGIGVFGIKMYRRIHVMEDDDGDLLTHSYTRQMSTIIAVTALLAVIAFGLLYLLKHMA